MKKAACFLLLAVCLVLTSCSGKKTEKLGAFSNSDMVLKLGDKTFQFGEDSQALRNFLGEPNDEQEILSCYYDGYDKTYKYDKIDVVTFPKDDKDILDEVIFYDATYSFKGGVKVGSGKADVIKAYGSKYFMESDAMIYNESNNKDDKNSPRLTFVLKDDVVTSVDFYSGSYFS